MKHVATLTPVLVLGLLLSLSATAAEQTPPKASSSGVVTEEKGVVTPRGDTAAKMTYSTVTATVEAVDMANRMVTIVRPDGKSFVVHADEQVRNLGQIKVGDKVTVEYYEGLVAEIAPPGASPSEMKSTTAVARAPVGERPAAALGKSVTATVVIEYVDPIRNVIHFKGPAGKTRVVKVMKPEFRTMLKTLKPGDQVTLTYFEALAVAVRPSGK